MPRVAKKSGREKSGAAPPLRLEWRDPAELAENPANWRRHPESQVAALSDVISEVGWAGACLYNERTKRLIDGHARRAVAVAQGGAAVPVLVGDWSEEQERKILATLDPLAGMAEADPAKLAALLADVDTESAAVEAMLADLRASAGVPAAAEPGGGGDEFDATPEAEGPTRTKAGEVWVVGGRHRLLVGDCTVPENVGRLFAGARPFLMVTDPPYGVDYDPEWRQESLPAGERRLGAVANDGAADWSAAWKLFPGDVAYVWHASLHIAAAQQSLVGCGFLPRSQVIWAKPGHQISRGHYHWQHEPCWYAVRKGATARWAGDRSQTTLWQIVNRANAEDKNDHGTQKPLECMARPIRNHGAEGDAVYDPFLGTGTTLVAAHRLNRVCYGCELEPRYCDVILRRAEAEGLGVERGG